MIIRIWFYFHHIVHCFQPAIILLRLFSILYLFFLSIHIIFIHSTYALECHTPSTMFLNYCFSCLFILLSLTMTHLWSLFSGPCTFRLCGRSPDSQMVSASTKGYSKSLALLLTTPATGSLRVFHIKRPLGKGRKPLSCRGNLHRSSGDTAAIIS